MHFSLKPFTIVFVTFGALFKAKVNQTETFLEIAGAQSSKSPPKDTELTAH